MLTLDKICLLVFIQINLANLQLAQQIQPGQSNQSLQVIVSSNYTSVSSNSSEVYIDPTITTFLNLYKQKKDFCYYLCQSSNIFQQWECYLQYHCYRSIIDDIIIVLVIILYVILPLFMLLLGVWTTECLARRIALFTGLTALNKVYQKAKQQISSDMETNYSLSSDHSVPKAKEQIYQDKNHTIQKELKNNKF